MSKLKKFTDFLEEVPLQEYRKKYSHIKIVEMDLPKNIQAIELLYTVYWEEKKFLKFPDFYKRYVKEKRNNIEGFRVKTTMCQDCFRRGLEARIYRTWAGLITQIHAGYVAEKVFGKNSVSMSAELDHKGADIQVNYKNHIMNYQVKKTSFSGVRSGRPISNKNSLKGKSVDILYEVPSCLNDPKTKKGEWRVPYRRFLQDKRTKALNNGFVIFTKDCFLPEKEKIDAKL